MNLFIDDIRFFKEYFVRGCREVRIVGNKGLVFWKVRVEILRINMFWGGGIKVRFREF